jgi:hypothetical protein
MSMLLSGSMSVVCELLATKALIAVVVPSSLVCVCTRWAHEGASGRSVVRFALGLFDVWGTHVQDAILRDVQARPHVTSLPAVFWSLLAPAGGRPRDIESIVTAVGEGSSYRQGQPQCIMVDINSRETGDAVRGGAQDRCQLYFRSGQRRQEQNVDHAAIQRCAV